MLVLLQILKNKFRITITDQTHSKFLMAGACDLVITTERSL